jgi:hypothetical protein
VIDAAGAMTAGQLRERHDGSRTGLELLRDLYLNRTGVLFLLMAGLSIGVIAASARTRGSASQFWLALGTSMLATTVYAFVQVMLTTQQFDRFLRGSIQESIGRQLAESQRQFMPSDQYVGVTAPGEGFNLDLNQSLRDSSLYIFRGVTGQYAVARLALLPRAWVPSELRLIMADPTKPKALDTRIQVVDGPDGDVAARRQELIRQIYVALVGAHVIRWRFDTVQVVLTADVHIERMEITDRDIFLTRFSGRENTTRFPSSMRFARESLIYQIYSRDCARLRDSPNVKQLDIPRDLSDEGYVQFLVDKGLDMTIDRLRQLRAEFEEFQRNVKPQLLPNSS